MPNTHLAEASNLNVVVLFIIVTCVYIVHIYLQQNVGSKYAQPIWAYKSLHTSL